MSDPSAVHRYYADKLESLKDLFGTRDVRLGAEHLRVEGRVYPIVEDVIILLNPSRYPAALRRRLGAAAGKGPAGGPEFAEDIQFTFGEEWRRFPRLLSEYEREFQQYFDLVDLSNLKGLRVCDLGCGIGRWSYFLKDRCEELLLVDYSEAIFVARHNLAEARNALFFMADLKTLPFRSGFADFLFCLGVLHHLPSPALDEVRRLRDHAQRSLVYLYYALDNRPYYFRILLAAVTWWRLRLSRNRNPAIRASFTWLVALAVYAPLLLLGSALRPLRLSGHVPLYEVYHGKGLERIRQDVYDRFFTRIEQRHTRNQIVALGDTFSEVVVSERAPYWHFLCRR